MWFGPQIYTHEHMLPPAASSPPSFWANMPSCFINPPSLIKSQPHFSQSPPSFACIVWGESTRLPQDPFYPWSWWDTLSPDTDSDFFFLLSNPFIQSVIGARKVIKYFSLKFKSLIQKEIFWKVFMLCSSGKLCFFNIAWLQMWYCVYNSFTAHVEKYIYIYIYFCFEDVYIVPSLCRPAFLEARLF